MIWVRHRVSWSWQKQGKRLTLCEFYPFQFAHENVRHEKRSQWLNRINRLQGNFAGFKCLPTWGNTSVLMVDGSFDDVWLTVNMFTAIQILRWLRLFFLIECVANASMKGNLEKTIFCTTLPSEVEIWRHLQVWSNDGNGQLDQIYVNDHVLCVIMWGRRHPLQPLIRCLEVSFYFHSLFNLLYECSFVVHTPEVDLSI